MSDVGPALSLDDVQSCFEGILPASICTCAADGTPNVTYLSIVHRIGEHHVGLSHQFFNKTQRNIKENPRAQVVVVSPETADQYRLNLQYERTESSGPLFDRVKTRLDAVASQTGMSGVFALRGVDVYRVLDCRPLASGGGASAAPRRQRLSTLDAVTERLSACVDLDSLLTVTLDALSSSFGYEHSFVMVPDETGRSLFTLASHGHPVSGVGSEARMGEGVLGVAAERRAVVRTTNVTRDMLLSRAIRSRIEQTGEDEALEREIPLPGLRGVQSLLVAPIVAGDELLGLVCLQSGETGRFLVEDEHTVQIVARQMAASMALFRQMGAGEREYAASRSPERRPAVEAAPIAIRYYESDGSVFIDDGYLIKGVAGRILWKVVEEHARTGRAEFTNKEIRLDGALQLPDIRDNLEARLVLLRRRLEERCGFLRLVPGGRGRFHLDVQRPLALERRP